MAKTHQGNLFEDNTAKKIASDEQIITSFQTKKKDGESAADLKLRRDFNSRIKAIARLKNSIENKLPKIFISLNKLFQEHIAEVSDQILDVRLTYMEKLDLAYQKKSWTQTEREEIRDLIINTMNQLIKAGRQIPEKFEKYTRIDIDELGEFEKSMLTSMVEDMTGIKGVDLEDILGEEKLNQEEFYEKYESSFAEEEEVIDQEASEKLSGIQQDIQKIYKSLAKKIHPDLEQDKTKREEKEQLMKELTSAKDKDDLFNVLMIQAKVNQYEETEQELHKETMKAYSEVLLQERKKLENEEWLLKNGNDFNAWLYKNFHVGHEKGRINRIKAYREELEEELF